MKKRLLAVFPVLLSAVSLYGVTIHRSFRRGYPAETRSATITHHENVLTNSVKVSGGFSKFCNKSWVTGAGRVTRILDDDRERPCHQRFILSDESGRTILIAHNIDETDRIADLSIGDVIAFKGEYVSKPNGGVVHWTHPSHSAYKPGGWLKKLKGVEKFGEAEVLQEPDERKEYFAGGGPMFKRIAAPINDDWPETGYWLSTNSGARHNKKCENYRKTRGYPCKNSEGRPCGKCGG